MPSKKQIESVWEKADEIRGRNAEVWRRDEEGNIIRHGSYGTVGEYGWEIDHRNPVAKGGTDNPRNLRALHWEENREKSDRKD
jgi:hypothetical protein